VSVSDGDAGPELYEGEIRYLSRSISVTHHATTGLLMLQHRGQDTAGIVTFEERIRGRATFHERKAAGLVATEDSTWNNGNCQLQIP
jgi:glutamine phosphoribosylpyrophosphate amidotransferase